MLHYRLPGPWVKTEWELLRGCLEKSYKGSRRKNNRAWAFVLQYAPKDLETACQCEMLLEISSTTGLLEGQWKKLTVFLMMEKCTCWLRVYRGKVLSGWTVLILGAASRAKHQWAVISPWEQNGEYGTVWEGKEKKKKKPMRFSHSTLYQSVLRNNYIPAHTPATGYLYYTKTHTVTPHKRTWLQTD